MIITERQVCKFIKKQRSNGAPGPNGIPALFYKEKASYWSSYLTLVFNQALQTRTIPESWKGSIISPIYKSGDWSLPSNYRLITLQDIEAKFFASILLELIDWAKDKHLIQPNQSDFVQGQGT